jgi:tRNA pseudouridine13 synthase
MSGALPRAHGAPVLRARYKAAPADFLVEELPSFEPTGEGEHLLLTVEKTGMNTAFAARKLAAWAGIPEMGIGYAGLKDRNARTRQRFSVHLPKRIAPDLASLEADDFHVLQSAWHNRKLSRGALDGNRFVLALRDATGERDAVEARLQAIAMQGLPNYFGEQRFGREGDNVAAARRMFAGARVKREQRSIYLSAARSAVFNAVLAARIAAGDWNRDRAGEVWMLDGTHSVFGPQPVDDTLRARCEAQDIHPTGPLWGLGEPRCTDDCRALEADVAAGFQDLCSGLEAAGLKQERRALRVRVGALEWRWLADDTLELDFQLPPGAYATELLAELGELAS